MRPPVQRVRSAHPRSHRAPSAPPLPERKCATLSVPGEGQRKVKQRLRVGFACESEGEIDIVQMTDEIPGLYMCD